MATLIITSLCIAAALTLLIRRSSMYKLEKVTLDHIDNARHCIIDIRDFITSSHQPVIEAENIPLSYLKRRARNESLCEKKIVLITDDLKAAKMAARIIKKTREDQQSFYYVLQ